MANTTTVNIRVDENIKREIETLFDGLGLNISTAVNMFFRQALMDEALPFLPSFKHKHVTLKRRLENFHGKDLETILKEADESGQKPQMADWGKPEGEEIW